MSKKKLFTIKTLISFLISTFLLSLSCIVIAGPDLEKDIKNDLSVYINNLNNGKISEYYNIYNTRKLTDIEKSLFYDKIKNAIKVVDSELETLQKFKLKVKIKDVNILRKVNDDIYLCNLSVDYQVREGINTTKTIKKSDEFILKILYTGKDGYKILLPFNSMDKDFSEGEIFTYLEQIYKDKKAKEIEEKRILEEKEAQENKNNEKEKEDANENYEDEHGLGYENDKSEDSNINIEDESKPSYDTEIDSEESDDDDSNDDSNNENKNDEEDEEDNKNSSVSENLLNNIEYSN